MSADVKNTIAILCKLTNLLYQTNLKPELFRLAKFNKTDENVVNTLWDSIFCILREKTISVVKNTLYQLGYRRQQFYYVTQDCSSRELLFALTFIVSVHLKKSIDEQIRNSVFSQSCDIFPDNNDCEGSHTDRVTERDLDNYKEWLYGKINLNKNMTIEYKNQINKIHEKFNKALNIKAKDSLTIYEVLAMKDHIMGQQFILASEKILTILNAYTEWLKKEKIFWKWMDSVLAEENKVQGQP